MKVHIGGLALAAALTCLVGCGGPPVGLATVEVAADGTVTAYLTDPAGGLIYLENAYLQIRGERTNFTYAGQRGSVQQLCEQVPTSGPLELRMTAPFTDCPEVHVAAYAYAPPVTKKSDGTKVPAPDVPVTERCSTYQTLMHSTFWIPGGCEEVRTDAPFPTTTETSTNGLYGL